MRSSEFLDTQFMRFELYRDGRLVLATDKYWELARYVHINHSYSLAHACEFEGYQVKEATLQ